MATTKKVRRLNIKNDVIFARIYKISNKIDNKVYIGSTYESLIKRLGNHMYSYTKGENMELYKHFSLLGLENFEMELLEYKVVKSVDEMRMLEQKWLDKEDYENLLNSKRAIKHDKYIEPYITNLVEKLSDIKIDKLNNATQYKSS